jgi:putative addiction module component (TIGR02574 family)
VTDRARTLFEEAKRLPENERADLAAELLATLDGERDSDVETEWAREIERRARRVLRGDSAGEPWDSVRERISRDLQR